MNEPVLLTENIHAEAVRLFESHGLGPVEALEGALETEALLQKLVGKCAVGVRSRTRLPAAVFENHPSLAVAGCFSIGTNQVDLESAALAAVPVFNSPFANSRSVAEMTIACAIFLMRRLPEKVFAMARGEWQKTAAGSYEVRAKKLGIVGYGNIGSQLSVVASALGMHVYYYDVAAKLRHGNARPVDSFEELLGICDVLTLHVPSTPQTRQMMNRAAILKMKKGAVLINHARGDLVDIDALADALRSGHLAGAAIDVFPVEPSGPLEAFVSPLRNLENVILTPHIGGSTQEAQEAIGMEVTEKMIRYLRQGNTEGAVNFPQVQVAPLMPGRVRICHVHDNAPGVLAGLNEIISRAGLNVTHQALATDGALGYVIIDCEGSEPEGFEAALQEVRHTRRARVLRDARHLAD
jgi:D-3-phosphoglycerate dehydrogenase / 2-oxoglutarate reductase